MMKKDITEYNFPIDLKKMSEEELDLLAYEIRDFLISNISKTGGHLASNLGVVELSIALHKFFDAPKDKIIWDVGHQSYVHKILTGRAEGFKDLRKLNGMSGFPKRSESSCDAYDSGHSSTSVSAAMGFVKARDLKKEDYRVVSVIGDGALTGGPAFEGLNNLGVSKSKAVIILNDNGMSIRQNTGGISFHLSKLRVSKKYYNFKHSLGKNVSEIPVVGRGIYNGVAKMRDIVKYAVIDGVLFEELGFKYFGPIDGHNIGSILEHLALAEAAEGPVVIHVITQKGKGYRNAELKPHKFHGTGPFDPTSGAKESPDNVPTYAQVFGNKMLDIAKKDESVVAISAAMVDGTGLEDFALQYPDRIFDVGIAEAHAVTFAASMAISGFRPVVAIYSTFLQRAYDQIMMDVCLQNLPVIFAIDRAGNVGADGETHHGLFDLSFLTSMPNMTVLAPKDGSELEDMLDYALTLNTPCVIRYPRGANGNLDIDSPPMTVGAEVISEGKDGVIWAAGSMIKNSMSAIDILKERGYDLGLVNPRFIKPIDEKALRESLKKHDFVFTIEDNVVTGGFGTEVMSYATSESYTGKIVNFGWPDKFIEHGSAGDLYQKYGLDDMGIADAIEKQMKQTPKEE